MIADETPSTSQSSLRAQRIGGLIALGAAAYVTALVATLPARVALHWAGAASAADAAGTVWNGAVPAGAATASWRFAPLRSIGRLALSADLSVDGPDTRLTGQADWRPGRLALTDVTGKAGWAVVAALAPRLPFACDLTFDVSLRRILLAGARTGAEGRLASDGGHCMAGPATGPAVPALTGEAVMDDRGTTLWIAPASRPSDRLVEATVAQDGKLAVSVHAAGAALMPSGSGIGAVTIETAL